MLRGRRGPALFSCCSARFISLGGRHTRAGFQQPLGKHPQVKQGKTDGVPRRIPGTTRVTYTNKKGRSFTFAIPVAELTHPQVYLTNASGSWREMDTSFCDLGDLEDDMPSPVDECLRDNEKQVNVQALYEAFVSFCKEYVLMDTDGMKNLPTYGELNVGPDYAHYDRKLKRKRHWLAIRHRFEDVREIIWPEKEKKIIEEEEKEEENLEISSNERILSVAHMLDALFWLEAASTFCVRKIHPADIAEKEEFLPLNLHREVKVVASYVREDVNIFKNSSNALELFISCAALCSNHGVPFSLFFTTPYKEENNFNNRLNDGKCILSNIPYVYSTMSAIRIMSIISSGNDDNIGNETSNNNNNAYVFSDSSGNIIRKDIIKGLLRLMSNEAFGSKDALENVGENELCTVMNFCVEVKNQNSEFFSRHKINITNQNICDYNNNTENKEDEVSFIARFQQVSQLALSRCRYLLYHLDGPRTQVMSEDEYIPLVELQKHTEKTNKNALVHYNLGIRNAQGLRRVTLRAQSSARLAELINKLEGENTRVSGSTLLVDLVHHLSHKAAASKFSLTLNEVNTILPLLARMKSETLSDKLDSRFDRLFAVIETTIGTAMQQERKMEEIINLLEGLANCQFIPSTFKQVEMVILRLMMSENYNIIQITRILNALSLLLNSNVSQVILQSAASHITTFVKLINSDEADQLIDLLESLRSCKYTALPGLVAYCREVCFHNGINLSLKKRCSYASLLASASLVIKNEDLLLSEKIIEESRNNFIEYAKNTKEIDINCFIDCITGLNIVGFGESIKNNNNNNNNNNNLEALKSYLLNHSNTFEKCNKMPTMLLLELYEGILNWCEILNINSPILKSLDKALLLKFVSSNKLETSEELAEIACRVINLKNISEELRKAAAEQLGIAILRVEEAADAWKLTLSQQKQQSHQSFEVVALTTAEKENHYMNTILRYCAALQRSGMKQYIEESVL